MQFNILGPLEVRAGERDVTCRGAKQRLLLSVLLLNANEVVSSDRLVDVLWGDSPPETSKALQMHISQLRKSLDPGVLVTRAPGYELRVAPADVDLHRFEAAVHEGRAALAAGRAADARRMLGEALALWRGPPLADMTFEDALQAEIARLQELRLEAVEARVEAELALGNHAGVVAELERLAAEHPTREHVRRHLMLALYRSGRQADALAVYRDTRRALVDELGIEPGRELQDLEARILAQDPELEQAPAAEPGPSLRGRDRELAALLPVVDGGLAGAGALVLIGGEPGIGKTRLAEALGARAAERGARVLVGRCWEAGGAPAYWPWVQALRPHAATGAFDGEAADRFELFEAVGALVDALARERAVAIFLDDVHAADSPSLLLLRFLAAQLAGTPVLIGCCYRDTEATPDLAATLADLAREPVAHRVALRGLDEAATRRLLGDAMGSDPESALAAQVHEGTRGNPLFVAELGRLLAAGEWRDGRLPIPEGVRETIGRRLERRSDRCREVLAAASAFGREFELEPLGRVCGLAEEDLHAAIEEAAAARFVGEVPGTADRLRFAHVLMRDALYDELTTPRRMRLHREIAVAFQGHNAPVSEIAHHFLHGGEAVADRAVEYATLAGEHAAAQHAHEEAARQFETALDVLARHGGDARRECELLLALGDALSRGGRHTDAKEPFQRAAAIADREGWPELLAQAALGYGGRFAWGRASVDPGLVPLLERALAAVGDDDSRARVRLLGRLASARRDEPLREARVRLAEEALAMARRLGDPETLAYALEAHWPAVEGPATLAGRLERADEMIELGRRTNDPERVFVAHDYRLNTFFILADRAGVDVEIARLQELAEELRQPVQRWSVSTAHTMVALLEGRFAEADELMEASLALGEETYRFNADVSHRVQLFLLRRAQGRLAELEPLIAQAVHAYPTLHRFRCLLAHLYTEVGDARAAREAFDRATAPDLRREYVDEEWLFAVNTLPETCAYVGDDDAARSLYELMLPYEQRYSQAPVEGTFGAMARGLGVLAAQLGRFDDAERHFAEAIAIERSMRARPWLAHARHAFGTALLARGDEARAHSMLEEAAAGYRELGMESWASRAAAL